MKRRSSHPNDPTLGPNLQEIAYYGAPFEVVVKTWVSYKDRERTYKMSYGVNRSMHEYNSILNRNMSNVNESNRLEQWSISNESEVLKPNEVEVHIWNGKCVSHKGSATCNANAMQMFTTKYSCKYGLTPLEYATLASRDIKTVYMLMKVQCSPQTHLIHEGFLTRHTFD